MADQKVTDLASATTPLNGSEILYVVQGGADRQATAQDVANLSGGGLTHFTEASNSSAPNATVPANSFTATNAATNVDAVLRPKGTGSLLGHVPDNTSTGGNKRGIYAVDWQTSRSGATEVASGDYSVIAGGFNNRASGTQSFSGGGLQNRANGGQSVVCGGQNNQATNSYTFIGGGLSNQATQVYATAVGGLNTLATGQWSFAGGGSGNTASGTTSVVVGGASNSASGQASWIPGGISASTRSIFGKYAWAANGGSGLIGGRQRGGWTGFVNTSNATTANVTTDGSAISAVNVDTLPDTVNGFTYRFTVYVTASSNSEAKSWEINGIITRNGGAATTAMVATPVKTVIMESAGATTWDCSVIADTTRGALVTQVTGQAATNIRWFTEHHTHEIWRPA